MTEDSHKPSKDIWANLVVVITTELIALPFCFSGGEGFMGGDSVKGFKGFAIGLPVGIAGLTFPWWRNLLSADTQVTFQREAKRSWFLVFALALLAILGPDIYFRAVQFRATIQLLNTELAKTRRELDAAKQGTQQTTKPEDASQSLSADRALIQSLQEKLATTQKSLEAARRSAEPPRNENGSRSSATTDAVQIATLRAQLEAAQQDLIAARRAAESSSTQPDDITWRVNNQVLIATGGGLTAQINSVLLEGTSNKVVSIKEAYVVSGLTGHRQEMMANAQDKGYFPVNKVDIPPHAPVRLELLLKPPLSVQAFMDQWGAFTITIVYADGTAFVHEYDENAVHQRLQQISGTFGPHITPRDGN